MPNEVSINKIDALEAIFAVSATLRRIDERLMDHGERVAYIAHCICKKGKLKLDDKSLFLLSVFHDIGAYKTDEIDRMLEFETNDVRNHSIYGYLFLKYMTPLRDYAEAVLYHHTAWSELVGNDITYREYAGLIYIADRIDVAMTYNLSEKTFEEYFANTDTTFCEEYVILAERCIKEDDMLIKLADGSYRAENTLHCKSLNPTATEALEYLKMIVYSIDFRSEFTVTHTINTVSIALNIARHFGLSEEEVEDIYLGALLHDVGKIAIPISILEYPGKLSDEQMAIMRTHVAETGLLIKGIISQKVCDLALRHHEKLDGSGYPLGLSADELTFSQRIVAVADIVSALGSRRSYKEPFPKEKTVSILSEMSTTKLDPLICEYIISDYENIMEVTEAPRLAVINQYQHMMKEFEIIKGQC